MAKLKFKGTFKDSHSNNNIQTDIDLLSFQEDSVFIIYAPALEISGYGKSLDEAKKSFEITLGEFFRYAMNKRTLIPELKRLGWTIKGGKHKRKISYPDFFEMVQTKEEVKEIFKKKDFRKYTETVSIPELA